MRSAFFAPYFLRGEGISARREGKGVHKLANQVFSGLGIPFIGQQVTPSAGLSVISDINYASER